MDEDGPSFGQLLDARLRTRSDEAFVTFYDDLAGSRTSLSVAQYATWVSRAATVLDDIDEDYTHLGVRLDLATQWLGPVFLGGCWLAGIDVVKHHPEYVDLFGRNVGTLGTGPEADVQVLGPRELATGLGIELRDGSHFMPNIRILCSLDGAPSVERVPSDVVDFGELWPAKPDAYTGDRGEPTWSAYGSYTWSWLMETSATVGLRPGERVLTDANPMTDQGVFILVSALALGGSTVWVTDSDPSMWQDRARREGVSREVRATG